MGRLRSALRRLLNRLPDRSLPDGLQRCPMCEEPRGRVRLSDAVSPAGLELDVSCICDGIPCGWCGQMPVRRPASSRFDTASANVRHSGTWASEAPCAHCRDDGAAAAPAAPAVATYAIGATPFLGETVASSDYFDTPRYASFESSLPELAAGHGVALIGVTRVQGIWRGNHEPSALISVRGDAAAVLAMMAELTDRWGQEGVVCFSAEIDGATRMHTGSTALTVDEICSMVADSDLPGITLDADGAVMLLDFDARYGERARAALARLGTPSPDVAGLGFVHLRPDAV